MRGKSRRDSGGGIEADSASAVTRRRVVFAGAAASLVAAGSAAAATRTVYFMRGKGANSLLPNTDYQATSRNLFKGDKVTFDLDGKKSQFLAQFFASDIAYLNLHAGETRLTVGGGETVEHLEFTDAVPQSGHVPALTIVAGYQTTDGNNMDPNLVEALGIGPIATSHAYIGFNKRIDGIHADRFFHFFFSHWINPGPDRKYRTLLEAGTATRGFIEQRLAAARGGSDRTADPAVLGAVHEQDKTVFGSYDVLGNTGLRVTDI